MRNRIPEMRYAEVPGRGHAPFLDEPEAVETINAWLDDCR
jgi:pimeloyl-ACP methyl ester carboxylesterase